MELNLIYIGTVLGVILVSMTIHEAMHGFMAYYLGDDTAKLQGRLTLNPIKHIDPFLTILLPILLALTPGAPIFGGAKPVPFNPSRVRYGEWGSALVAIAGPLTNLLFAFVSYGILATFGPSLGTSIAEMLSIATLVNLGFFVFNMLPVPPLDGSRVLYAIAPDGVRRVLELVERFGLILVFMLIIVASPLIAQLMFGGINMMIGLFTLVFGAA